MRSIGVKTMSVLAQNQIKREAKHLTRLGAMKREPVLKLRDNRDGQTWAGEHTLETFVKSMRLI